MTATEESKQPQRLAGKAGTATADPDENVDLLEPVQHPRRWAIFATVATAMLMGNIDQTVVATALPTLHHSLHATINWVAWTVTTYQLGMVIALPVAGRISDQFGRRKVFLFCLAIFGISSLACGLSNSIWMLIVFRGLQAIGAGGFMPSAAGIVADHFGKDRDRGIGLFVSFSPAGALIGPVLGGLIIYFWSWRGVFLINIPIAIGVFLCAILIIPRSTPRPSAHADFAGIALLVLTILPMMYGITALGDGRTSVTSPRFLVPEITALLLGGAFIRHTNGVASPIIPLKMLRDRAFATMNAICLLYGGCVLGYSALVPLYAEERYHFVSIQAGSVLSARAIGMLLVAGIATMLLRRTGYRKPMILGFGLVSIGMFLIGGGVHLVSPYTWLMVSAGVLGVGAGMATPATNNAVLSFSPSNVASLSGLRGMFRQIGAIIAISVTSSIAARSTHPGVTLGHTFMVFAIVLFVIAVPLIMTVPDRRGTW